MNHYVVELWSLKGYSQPADSLGEFDFLFPPTVQSLPPWGGGGRWCSGTDHLCAKDFWLNLFQTELKPVPLLSQQKPVRRQKGIIQGLFNECEQWQAQSVWSFLCVNVPDVGQISGLFFLQDQSEIRHLELSWTWKSQHPCRAPAPTTDNKYLINIKQIFISNFIFWDSHIQNNERSIG